MITSPKDNNLTDPPKQDSIAAFIMDAARLDFLESRPFSQLICTNEGGVHRWVCQDRKDNKTIACAGWTARAAIDSAMKATKGDDRKWDQ